MGFLKNIARGGIATSSAVDTHYSYYSAFDKDLNKTVNFYYSFLTVPGYANDGSAYTGDIYYTCIPTSSENWLKIDLKTIEIVHHFHFFSISHRNFDIFVGNNAENPSENTVCLRFNGGDGSRQRCNVPLSGQFVWIISNSGFCVEEVMIFGEYYY